MLTNTDQQQENVTQQEILDWIKTVRALGEHLGESDVVDNVDAIINKCIEYLTIIPSDLDGVKGASKNTKAIVEKNHLDILVHDKAYHQNFFYHNSNGDKPVKLSLVGKKNSQQAVELNRIAGNVTGQEKELSFPVPKLLLDVEKRVSESKGTYYYLKNRKECKEYFTGGDCPECCLVLPMHYSSSGCLGYFILKHREIGFLKPELASLFGIIANDAARAIRRILRENREKTLQAFNRLLHNSTSTDESYYVREFNKTLKKNYGNEVEAILFLRNRMTGGVEENADCNNNKGLRKALSEDNYNIRTVNLAKAFILSQDFGNKDYVLDFTKKYNRALNKEVKILSSELAVKKENLKNLCKGETIAEKTIKRFEGEISDLEVLINEKEVSRPVFETKKEKSLNATKNGSNKLGFHTGVIVPLHRKVQLSIHGQQDNNRKEVNIGCLILRGVRIKEPGLVFLDALTDALAQKLYEVRLVNIRYEVHNFEDEIQVTKNYDKEKLLEKMTEYLGKVMNSENMFIALKNEKQEIKFPVFIKSGKVRLDIAKRAEYNDNNQPRLFDKKSRNKGRVEEILGDGRPILIHTLSESKEWYDPELGREEKIGNPYSSWIGVPLKHHSQTIGVIAVFHATEEHLYSDSHVDFLSRLSKISSHLLSNIRSEEANKRLEKAQSELQNQSAIISTSILAQDITHRLKNSLGSIMINLKDIANEKTTRSDISFLADESSEELKKLLSETKKIISNDEEDFDLVELINKAITQIIEARKMPNEITIAKNFYKSEIKTNSVYRDLFNCIHILIDNAVSVLISDYKNCKEELFLQIKVLVKNSRIYIHVIDNGSVIPKEFESQLFKFGSTGRSDASGTGYGLWRANQISNQLGGSLEYVKNSSEKKSFILEIPIDREIKKKVAYVLDDESSWRRIFKRWLEKNNYTVLEGASTEDAKALIHKNPQAIPSIVIVDLSMESLSAHDIQGLEIAKLIREHYEDTKIVLVSGYIESLKDQDFIFDGILEKINKNDEPISKEVFLEVVNRLGGK